MELTLTEALQKGIEAHKAGQIQKADQYYTAILKTQPKHPDANHNMGVLAVGVGKMEEALPFFKTALEANPNIGQYWLSYIEALIKLDRKADAKAILDQAKRMGANGEIFEQLENKVKNLTLDVTNRQVPEELLNHFRSLLFEKKFQCVISEGEEALSNYKNPASIYNIMGIANASLKQAREAETCYKKAIELEPDFFKPYSNLGISLKDQGKLEEAIDAFNGALKIQPSSAEVHNNVLEILKVYSPEHSGDHILFDIDKSSKIVSNKLLVARSNKEITDLLVTAMECISIDKLDFKSPLSQIYKRNHVDLNCARHKAIFNSENIIAERCFGCFNVFII